LIDTTVSYLFLINFILMGSEVFFSQYTPALRNTFLFARYAELSNSFKNMLTNKAGFRILSIVITAAIITLILKIVGINPFESSQIASCGNTFGRPAGTHGAGTLRATNTRLMEVAAIAVIMSASYWVRKNEAMAKHMQSQRNQAKYELYMQKHQTAQRKLDRAIEEYYNIHKNPESDDS
jgi:hypothetical protein